MADPKPVTNCECGYPLFENQPCPECGREFAFNNSKSKPKFNGLLLTTTIIGALLIFVVPPVLVITGPNGCEAFGSLYLGFASAALGALLIIPGFIISLIRRLIGRYNWMTTLIIFIDIAIAVLLAMVLSLPWQ